MKLPSKKDIKKAIEALEESDEIYKMDTNFQAVTVLDIRIEDDEEFAPKIFYDAKVDYFNKSETFYDCYVLLTDLIKLLPKELPAPPGASLK